MELIEKQYVVICVFSTSCQIKIVVGSYEIMNMEEIHSRFLIPEEMLAIR